jgi:hypothetical protein
MSGSAFDCQSSAAVVSDLEAFIYIVKLTMLEKTEEEVEQWRSAMREYEKSKRTKKPFGREPPSVEFVTHKDVKQKEALFNPVLQTFANGDGEAESRTREEAQRAKSLLSHAHRNRERPYDIVNLHEKYASPAEGGAGKAEGTQRRLGPIRNAYNVISNERLPELYFRNR